VTFSRLLECVKGSKSRLGRDPSPDWEGTHTMWRTPDDMMSGTTFPLKLWDDLAPRYPQMLKDPSREASGEPVNSQP
jgi:hypothetical protein